MDGGHQQAVDNIKNAASSTLVLRFLYPNVQTIIQTDVSSTGLDAVLMENDQPLMC